MGKEFHWLVCGRKGARMTDKRNLMDAIVKLLEKMDLCTLRAVYRFVLTLARK